MAVSSSVNLNGVASCTNPCKEADFPAMISIIMAIVIREGKPWGLKIISGTKPRQKKVVKQNQIIKGNLYGKGNECLKKPPRIEKKKYIICNSSIHSFTS